ncbi:MAG TPA: KH domain-containing protein [Verrucomicrobiae bacterium]|nr:KH domain-containing protein [Verrucomicrobiae bacterium]
MNNIDQQFIEYVVKSLVGKPEAVKVDRRIDEKGVLLELTVDPEDLGRVIGKRGATAQSLRTLLRALGTKNDARYNLKIVDNGVGSHSSSYAGTSDDSSGDDTTADEPDTPAESVEEEVKSAQEESQKKEAPASDRLAQTRQELADLDDLDV